MEKHADCDINEKGFNIFRKLFTKIHTLNKILEIKNEKFCAKRVKKYIYFRSTFTASRFMYMINKEYKRRGRWAGLLWFQDPTLLIGWFHNPLLGISFSTEVSSIEGVETDTYLLVSVYGKGVEDVLVMINPLCKESFNFNTLDALAL